LRLKYHLLKKPNSVCRWALYLLFNFLVLTTHALLAAFTVMQLMFTEYPLREFQDDHSRLWKIRKATGLAILGIKNHEKEK